MRLELSKTQMRLVHCALECYERSLNESKKFNSEEIIDSLGETFFQLELLITWFDKQKEMEC